MINITFKTIVYCRTYNQSGSITNALDGFVDQTTEFPFICAIFDDASTDGEQTVIRDYFNHFFDTKDFKLGIEKETDYAFIEFGRHKTNKNCHFLIFLLKENHYGKKNVWPYLEKFVKKTDYIAWCEGDDYWTDSTKLQRQTEFLELHNDYSAVSENGIEYNSIYNTKRKFSDEPERDLTIRELIIKRRFPTASVMCRYPLHMRMRRDANVLVDTIFWCLLCSYGKFRYFENVSSIYNRGMQGVTENTPKLQWAKRNEMWDLELMRLFSPKYVEKDILIQDIYAHFLYAYLHTNDKQNKKEAFAKMREYKSLWHCLKDLFKQRVVTLARILMRKE